MKNSSKITLIVLILATFILSGCGSTDIHMCPSGVMGAGQQLGDDNVFICPDGSKTKQMMDCNYPLQTSIDKRTANENALSYIDGYTGSAGWDANIVNINLVNGSYYAQIVLSKYQEEPYETRVRVDGTTGEVRCATNCLYLS